MSLPPDNRLGTGPAVGRQVVRVALNGLLAVSLAATVLPRLHRVAGVFLLAGCGVHLALHGRWIKAVILATPGNFTPAIRRQRRLFWATILTGPLCGLSGLAIESARLPRWHHFVVLIHVLSGLAFLGLNIRHLARRRGWFRKSLTVLSTRSRG